MKASTQKVARSRAVLKAAATVVAVVVLLAHAARAEQRAATLAEYRGRVHEATVAFDALADSIGEGEDGEEAAALEGVRRMLPKTERVEWAGATVEVDNGWLHDALDAYEKAGGDADAETLRDIAARLSALEARLAEAEGGAVGARDKDAEKGRLNTILRRPEYNREAAQGGALQRQVELFFEWLRGLIPDFGPIRPGTRGGLSRAAQWLVFGLSLAVLAFAFRHFWRRRERGRKKGRRREARVVLGERLEADQTAADLLAESERLAREGNLRAAIRKAYVALLCELGDRRVIRLAQHKTNRDYLQAVRHSAPRLYPEMLPLTFDFELHWYGAQDASETDWADFRARCRSALRAI